MLSVPLFMASTDVCVNRLGNKFPHTVASKISYGNFKMFYSFSRLGDSIKID